MRCNYKAIKEKEAESGGGGLVWRCEASKRAFVGL